MRRVPNCHPNKKYGARGMCCICYNKWLRHTNPEYKKSCTESSAKARNKPEGIRARDSSLLKQRYGITLEEKEQIMKSQDGKCAICKKPKKLVVEHSHSTGKVRGLTCHRCNTIIAIVEHESSLLPVVQIYLGRAS